MEERWFVTGDKHGDLLPILQFIWRFDLGEESRIIVCGDMGICWRKDKKDFEAQVFNYERNCNGVHLYWIDGNHENFDIINSFEGGPIYHNSEHIHYISRGTTFSAIINGNKRKMLFLGGADSIDKSRRIEGLSWWPQEQITLENINKVFPEHYDYVFTHCCPYSYFHKNRGFLCTHGGELRDITHQSEEMLDLLFDKITYNHHYFGHYHTDMKLDEKHTCLFKDFIELN